MSKVSQLKMDEVSADDLQGSNSSQVLRQKAKLLDDDKMTLTVPY